MQPIAATADPASNGPTQGVSIRNIGVKKSVINNTAKNSQGGSATINNTNLLAVHLENRLTPGQGLTLID